MKPLKSPFILKHSGIQVHLSESPISENLVSVEVAGRATPGAIDASVIEVRTLRVLGNKYVVKWLDSV